MTPEQREKAREYARKWREKNREKLNQTLANWRDKNREKLRTYGREWSRQKYATDEGHKQIRERRRDYGRRRPDKIRQWNQTQYWKDHSKVLDYHKTYRWKLKMDVIAAYGGVCKCCGEGHPEMLGIDHVNGYKDGPRGANKLYLWLRKNKYPQEEFQLLCMNCNMAKSIAGCCPHELDRTQSQVTPS